MARVVLGVTGSVAAIRTLELVQALVGRGDEVRVVLTAAATYFVTPEVLRDAQPGAVVCRDADEWPPPGYRRDDPVLHIELRSWADVLIIAPLDAHTLAKVALGLADNLLSCLVRAWDFVRPIILAPAMNTLMWESPITRRHLATILADRATRPPPATFTLEEAPLLFEQLAPSIVLIPPQEKRLACGDVGLGAIAEPADILAGLDRVMPRVAHSRA